MDFGQEGMNPAMMGALFGAAVAILNYFVTLWLASRLESDGSESGPATARLIKKLALGELVLLPLLGYLVWPMILG